MLSLLRDMAMARSALNGMRYLYTQAEMGATYMLQTWRRILICLLVLASLPFLAPVIVVSMMVGGVFLVPLLCGVTAYYALLRPASLSNIIKWFRSPKSVQAQPAKLVMEDFVVHDDGNRDHGASLGISNLDRQRAGQEGFDIDSEYVIVSNEADQSEPQEFNRPSSPLNASEFEVEASGLTSRGDRSTAGEIVEESNAVEAVQKNEEDKVTALVASKSMRDDEVATSGVSVSEGSNRGIKEDPLHKESVLVFPSETPLAVESSQQLDGHEEVQGEEVVQGGNESGEERVDPTSSSSSYKEPVEEGDPVHELASIDTVLEHSLPVEENGNEAILEEPNKEDAADSSNAGRAPEEEDSALDVLSKKELAEETMEDKDVVLHGRDERGQGEENRPSDSLLSREPMQEKTPPQDIAQHSTNDSCPVSENQDLESEDAEYNAFHFDDQEKEPGEDQVMSEESPDKDSLEDEFPILEITASGIPLEEVSLPADELKPTKEVGKSEVSALDSQQSELGEEDERVGKELNDAHIDPNRPLVPEEHPEKILGSETIAREVDGSATDMFAIMHMGDKQQEKDDDIGNSKELNELPAFEHVKTGTTADYQDFFEPKHLDEPKRLEEGSIEAQSASGSPTAPNEPESFVERKAVDEGKQGEGHPTDQLNAQCEEHEYLEESEGVKEVREEPSQVQFVADKRQEQMEEPKQLEEGLPEVQPVFEDSTAPVDHLEESNAVNDESGDDYSGAGHPVLVAREQQQLEEPTGFKEGATEAQPASEGSAALGEPEHLFESEETEEEEDKGHPGVQLTLGKEQERFDEYKAENKESGQPVSASTQPLHSDGKLEHSDHGLPLKHAIQQVDEVDAIEGDSEVYDSAPDSFSPSENEQEQADVIESNAREPNAATVHGLEENTESNLKEAVAKEDVALLGPVAKEAVAKEVARPVSEPVSEDKDAPRVEEEAEAAPALEPKAPVIENKHLPLEEAASMDEVSPFGVADPVDEVVVKKTVEPESQVIEEELEAPAPEVVKEVGPPVAKDVSIVESEMTKESDAEPSAPQVVAEDGSSIVPEKEVEPRLVVSEPVSEEAEAAPTLKSEALVSGDKSPLEEKVTPVEDAALMGEGVAEKGEESEAPEVDLQEIRAPVAAVEEAPVAIAPAEEGAVPETDATIAEPEVTKETEVGQDETEEASSMQDEVELPLLVPEPEAEVPEVEEAPTSTGLESEALVIAQKSLSREEAAQVEKPAAVEAHQPEPLVMEEKGVEAHVAETSFQEKVDEAPEVEAPDNEPKLTKGLEAELAAPTFIADEKALDVREVELPLAVSEPVSEEQAPAVPELEPEVPVVTEKSLPVSGLQVEAAPVEKVGESEASAVEKTDTPHDTALPTDTSSEATVRSISPPGKDTTDGIIKSRDHGAEDVTRSAANVESGSGEEHDADVAVQKLEENFGKDKAVGSHTEQDVFPTLRPLNVAQSKGSPQDTQPEESDSIPTSAPNQRRISFDEGSLRAPSSPNRRAGTQGTNLAFKSRFGRDHRTHRHSAPDFLATHTWVREAPLYSPQDNFRGRKKAKYKKWSELAGARPGRSYSVCGTDSTERPHTGEFGSLLQSWQERDKATTHSPASASSSGSPRPPAEIGRQIREEINTIQKIIGQEIPPQYSLWKEVETLCQVVGMELPYMGDVSDLTKARHGLDLLKVVVGIK